MHPTSIKDHIATVNLDERELRCSIDPLVTCNMNEIELKWMEEVKPPRSDAGSPTISQLVVELKEETARWYELAVHMRIPLWKLAVIKRDEQSSEDCLIKALEYWQKNADPSRNPFTWDTVIQALKKMKNNRLADAIAKKCHDNPQVMISSAPSPINAIPKNIKARHWATFLFAFVAIFVVIVAVSVKFIF